LQKAEWGHETGFYRRDSYQVFKTEATTSQQNNNDDNYDEGDDDSNGDNNNNNNIKENNQWRCPWGDMSLPLLTKINFLIHPNSIRKC